MNPQIHVETNLSFFDMNLSQIGKTKLHDSALLPSISTPLKATQGLAESSTMRTEALH
jgi:hypothetical protein